MPRTKIAIVGCGTLTTDTILPHLEQPDFREFGEVVALCDSVPGRARRAGEVFSVADTYEDYEAMLASSDAEVVLVITPAASHAHLAIRAFETGRHVYLQKPMAVTVADALAVLEARDRANRKLVCAPGQVLWPLYTTIRDLIRKGVIGKPYLAVPTMLGWGSAKVDFPFEPYHFFGPTGGPLRDHGGYGIHALTTMLGPIKRVTAFGAVATPERTWRDEPFAVTGPDNFAVLFDFGDGTFGLMPDAWSASSPAAAMFRINGLEGSIDGDAESQNWLKVLVNGATVYNRDGAWRVPFDLADVPFLRDEHWQWGHVHVYGDICHLVECVRNNETPRASGEWGLHNVEVIEAVFRAVETGVVQDVPPARFTV